MKPLGIEHIAESVTKEIMTELDRRSRDNVKYGYLYQASKHLFTAGGKRLRPYILYLFAVGLGGADSRAISAGTAVEMIHVFTLIHDDIMDHDELRRGIPTVHKKYGEATAILAGDLLHSIAFNVLSKSMNGLKTYHTAIERLSASVEVIAQGQAMDMMFEHMEGVEEEDYLDMISKKTGELFGAAAALGACVAEADDNTIDNAYKFGLNMGIAFQIRDDILGITAKEEELGKPLFSDIREGKKTILVIKSLKEAIGEEKAKLINGLGNKSLDRKGLEEVAKIVERLSLNYANGIALTYVDRALQPLSHMSFLEEEVKKELTNVVYTSLKRMK